MPIHSIPHINHIDHIDHIDHINHIDHIDHIKKNSSRFINQGAAFAGLFQVCRKNAR